MHRCLKMPYGAEPFQTKGPKLLGSKGDWLPLFSTHKLRLIYDYWKKLITDNKDKLLALASGSPDMNVPAELDAWIYTVAEIDPEGEYFRFPISKKNPDKDNEKSPFKEISPEELFPHERTAKYVKALLVENSKGELVQVFKHDGNTQKDIAEAVWKAANQLSGFQAMMRFELTGGW